VLRVTPFEDGKGALNLIEPALLRLTRLGHGWSRVYLRCAPYVRKWR
jgi:hypothetical protein